MKTQLLNPPAAPEPPPRSVTALLAQWADGDREAADRLLPLVYNDLRRIAARYARRERRGHTLSATAIVHEAYLQLVEQRGPRCRDRRHFFAFAAAVLRRVLVAYARQRGCRKRGGGLRRVTWVESEAWAMDPPANLVDLDEALDRLAAFDPRKARIVELRFFGGLTGEEIAATLNVGTATVSREWRSARAWLFAELSADGPQRP